MGGVPDGFETSTESYFESYPTCTESPRLGGEDLILCEDQAKEEFSMLALSLSVPDKEDLPVHMCLYTCMHDVVYSPA
jgi:hypothetical protein